MRLIDGDALEELFREVIGGIAKKPEMNGNLEHMVRASAMVIEMIQDAPTIEERKTGHWNRLMMYLADLQLTYAPMGGHGDIRLYEFVTGLIEELEGWEENAD